MKALLTVVCVLVLRAVIAFAGYRAVQAKDASTHAAGAPTVSGLATSPSGIGVEQLMKNVDKYHGPVRVTGVVAVASQQDQKIALIDAEEFRRCGDTHCAELVLPVRWSGTMPKVKDSVLVDGEVKDEAGKMVFVASSVSPAERGK